MRAPIRIPATAAAGLLVGLLALTGCGSDGGDDASDASTSTTAEPTTTAAEATTTEATATTAATETTAPAETTTTLSSEGRDTETSELDTLPDGVHYGYMAGLESGTVEGQPVQVIIFDKVDFLTGAEAVAAAKEDGVIPADQDSIENDYYVRNQNQTVRRIAVVPEAQVATLAEGGTELVPSSVDEVWNQPYLFKIDVGNVRGITTISSIEAVYLP